MALLEHQYSLLVFPFQLHLPNHTCIGLALPRGAVKKKTTTTTTNKLRATRGARNPNLQVVITHASHICTQHSFRLPVRMNGMHKSQNAILLHAFRPSTPRNLITSVLTICQVQLTQRTELEQKRLISDRCRPTLIDKTADIWRRYHWFPRQMTCEKRAQKLHTDDTSLA